MKWVVVALAAVCACGRGDAPPSVGDDVQPFVPPSAAELADFLPPRLAGAGRQVLPDYMKVKEGDGHAAYLAASASGVSRTLNLNLAHVAGEELEQARHLMERGKRFRVHGRRVQRTVTPEARRTEARALVADAVLVTLTVDGAEAENESVQAMAEVDLDGIERLIKRSAP